MGNLKPKLHVQQCLIALPLAYMSCKPCGIHVQSMKYQKYLMFNVHSNMLGTMISCLTKWKYFHFKNSNIIVTYYIKVRYVLTETSQTHRAQVLCQSSWHGNEAMWNCILIAFFDVFNIKCPRGLQFFQFVFKRNAYSYCKWTSLTKVLSVKTVVHWNFINFTN